MFFILLKFSIKIPFQQAQALGSTTKKISKIEKNRKACAAINSFEAVFSKNVECPYFLLFYASKCANKNIDRRSSV
jgi:hypothetical protein